MVDELPDPEASRSEGRQIVIGWHSYEGYRVIHDSYIRRLSNDGIVIHDGISFVEARDDRGALALIAVTGRLQCVSRVVCSIDHRLDVRRDRRNRHEVRTLVYRYHAWQESDGHARDLLRIDNAHGADLHRHVFDTGGSELRREAFTLDEMPTIDILIRQAISLAHA